MKLRCPLLLAAKREMRAHISAAANWQGAESYVAATPACTLCLRYLFSNLHKMGSEGEVLGFCLRRCILCLAEYADGDQLRELSCEHMFHADCVDEYVLRFILQGRFQRFNFEFRCLRLS